MAAVSGAVGDMAVADIKIFAAWGTRGQDKL
jgi:hypothetical protein